MEHLSGRPAGSVTMKGYVRDQVSSASSEWPRAWVIVTADPGRWRATLPLHELIELLAEPRRGIRLGGLPYLWGGRELVVQFGPTSVRSSSAGWRGLARRVLATAGSASRLHETPQPRPWDGPTAEIDARDVDVPDAEIPWWLPPSGSPDRLLASAGGFEDWEFVQLLGGGWTPVRGEVTPSEEPSAAKDIFHWGEPPQLAAAVVHDGLHVGQARYGFRGPAQEVAELREPVPFNGTMPLRQLTDIRDGLLHRRRRSFSWCRSCGSQLAPERRHRRDLCHGCASRTEGVVY